MSDLSLMARFVDIFLKRFMPVMREKRWDLALTVLALLFFGAIGGFTGQAWRDNAWKVLTPWVWLTCSIGVVHVMVSANMLINQIRDESSPIILPGEHGRTRRREEKRKSVAEVPYYRAKVWTIASISTMLLAVPSFLAWNAAKSPSMPMPLPLSQPVSSTPDPFRVVIDYIRTDSGMYGKRTLFMAYYLLDKLPALSPIDLATKLRIVNLNPSTPEKIEAWSVETGPTDRGPWLRLINVPASPFTNVYVVGSNPKGAARFIVNDLGRELTDHEIEKELTGWGLFECPSPLSCLMIYVRINLRDIRGGEHRTLVNLIERNKELEMSSTEPTTALTSKYHRLENMENIRIVRPFPGDAYWVVPNDESGVPQGFSPGHRPSK
jgi:hypothetical protein